MPLQISRNDIRQVVADAIVDPTNRYYYADGGTDLLIHEMAGPRLDEYLMTVPPLEVGEAIATEGFDCENCCFIIHTHGPVYLDGLHQEREYLASCYRNCLDLALQLDLHSIAFPLISSGTFGFPKGEALRTAVDEITSFLLHHEMDIILLVYDQEAFDTASQLFTGIRDYLAENLTQEAPIEEKKIETHGDLHPPFIPQETFSETLVRMIDEKGLKDPDVYHAANIDRKHFNHMINTRNYQPKKKTVLALAIGMKLDLEETMILLERAGYAFSSSSRFDLIVRYCIEQGITNIYEVNLALYEEGEDTLGA